ncbi:DNA adenine methylase [Fusibacter paucivorans]|uniref:site-specific DNA-methyltransferase (adenine-specific) n=1 Tax=Fusibacter paucivorans TaxID=76009 RepID=A0ABS5PKY1_9FIRM|nr:DNA adenine methylase [Fusibacter paucivorans]MBS7525226.1 DNA adenine methylase [Fusibacter paucivorans]
MIKPFIKWPGGKTTELKIIHENLPEAFQNYIEPFVGGGACFLSLDRAAYQKAYLNDASEELMGLYQYIQSGNHGFIDNLEAIWSCWSHFGDFSDRNYQRLRALYAVYKAGEYSTIEGKILVSGFVEAQHVEMIAGVPRPLQLDMPQFVKTMTDSIYLKFRNTKKNERAKGDLPEADYHKNFEAGIKTAVYTYFRTLYNRRTGLEVDREMHMALFFFLREFCYSSMFRYNKDGDFNVPYGGASYNRKNFKQKIEYLRSAPLKEVLQASALYNKDFEMFLETIPIHENDFMFVDPPYDTEFSTYANNDFNLNDQKRLADYLLNTYEGRFMVIIKNTDYIYSLYHQKGIRIIGFDKSYAVSFMDRNERAVNHLLIMNY